MHIYITLAHFALALALCGGFFFGRFLFTRRVQRLVENEVHSYWKHHYRNQYNVQMGELIARYKQERLAMIHRVEGLTADLEQEIKWLKAGCDPDATQRSYAPSYLDDLEATDLVQHVEDIKDAERGVS